MTPAALLQEYLQKQAVTLTANAEAGAANWAKLTSKAERDMLRILEKSTTPVTPEEAARVLAEMRKVLGESAQQAIKLADQDAFSVFRLGFGGQSDYFGRAYGAKDAFAIRTGRIAQTFRRYDQLIESGDILRGPYWQTQRADWTQQYVDRMTEVTKATRRELMKGFTTGQSPTTPRDVAATIRPLVEGNTGRMDAETWARSFARTNQQQLYGDFAEQLAVDAGIDKFVNVGVPDDRQSRECYEASQQPPMTMQEWDGWTASNGKGGRPGSRHVFNCRCIGGAVPPGLEDDDWSQPNEKFEAVATAG